MDERDPIAHSEFVYRRIHRIFFEPTVPIPIRFAAFRPNSNDATGLSVFRALFLQPAETLANIEAAKQVGDTAHSARMVCPNWLNEIYRILDLVQKMCTTSQFHTKAVDSQRNLASLLLCLPASDAVATLFSR